MVKDATDEFLSYLNLQKRYSALTVQSYATDLGQFVAFMDKEIGSYTAASITHKHIRQFLADQMANGASASTVNHKLSALKSFFKYLLKNEVIAQNPTQRLTGPKTPKRLPVFVDQMQMDAVFSTLEFGSDFEGLRNKLIIDILYQTGLRRAELLNLKEGDVDIFNTQLKVLGKRSKERIIPFDLALKRNLENYLRVKQEQNLSNPYLLVTAKNIRLSTHQLTKIVKDVLSGVTTIKKKSPHVLRHTFATHILDNGADINAVKELLGHASLAATQVYTHNTIDKLKKMYNRAHPRSGQ